MKHTSTLEVMLIWGKGKVILRILYLVSSACLSTYWVVSRSPLYEIFSTFKCIYVFAYKSYIFILNVQLKLQEKKQKYPSHQSCKPYEKWEEKVVNWRDGLEFKDILSKQLWKYLRQVFKLCHWPEYKKKLIELEMWRERTELSSPE